MVVRQNATISDIKNLIVLQVTRDLKEKGRRNKKISWYAIISHLLLIYLHILILFHYFFLGDIYGKLIVSFLKDENY
jgi:hypothetical protein